VRILPLGALALSLLCAVNPVSAAESDATNPFASAPLFYTLKGEATQGGLMVGKASPHSTVMLDGKPVLVAPDGSFVIGFSRDHRLTAELEVSLNRGPRERRTLVVMPRVFDIQSITGVAQKYVEPSPEDMKRIKEEQRLIREARARRTMVSDFAGGFAWPITGIITSVYGSQRVFNGQPRAPHLGVDIAAPRGTPIHAAADGVVALAGPDLFFNGSVMILDHGLGLTTVYAHMSEFLVKPGEHVKKGQVIGKVGATGRATGPHLHWGANWAGVGVDPSLLVGPMPKPMPKPAPKPAP
jgi:murein DD-endopeptidase MepM/ murein hydrolase activator NlpD